ncbi:MAG TPA: SDR family oxidoreductase [Vicinamibacteria bacterium]
MGAYSAKTIVLTGASQGIGRALALALSEQRPNLVLAARDRGALDEVATQCRKAGAQTLVVPTDVADEAQCRALVEEAVSRFSGIDVLLNNAGIGMIARFEEVQDLALFERIMKVNFLGCVYPTFHALPHLKKSRGQIAVMASLAGLTGVPTRTGYAASKHAVIGFFDSLRIELRGTGVDVTVVCPYFVRSEIHRRAAGGDGEALGQTPLKEDQIMTAEECAARTIRAMQARRRMLVFTAKGKLGRFLRLVAPSFVDHLAEQAVKRGR